MFGFLKNSGKPVEKKQGVKSSAKSEALRAEAMKNVRAAREAIGDETLQRIAAAIAKKQSGAMEQAKHQIINGDKDRLRDELRLLIEDR